MADLAGCLLEHEAAPLAGSARLWIVSIDEQTPRRSIDGLRVEALFDNEGCEVIFLVVAGVTVVVEQTIQRSPTDGTAVVAPHSPRQSAFVTGLSLRTRRSLSNLRMVCSWARSCSAGTHP